MKFLLLVVVALLGAVSLTAALGTMLLDWWIAGGGSCG